LIAIDYAIFFADAAAIAIIVTGYFHFIAAATISMPADKGFSFLSLILIIDGHMMPLFAITPPPLPDTLITHAASTPLILMPFTP
jgi:hypothetical protein